MRLGAIASFIDALTGTTEKVKFKIIESWESKYAHIFIVIDGIYHINWHVLCFPKVLNDWYNTTKNYLKSKQQSEL